MPDYYAILGIQPTATSGQIKIAYRRLALRFHPDKNPDDLLAEKKFIELAEAYEILSNPLKRRNYDDGLPIDIDQEVVTAPQTRRRPPPQFYYQNAPEKIHYTRKDYLFATGAVILIIIIAIVFPVYLLKKTSAKYYNQAISYYYSGRYYSALQYIDLSIQDVSKTDAEACALASVILVHKLHKYEYALKYINRGLGYHPSDSLSSEFHYLKGICLTKTQEPEIALSEFKRVGIYSPNYDSSLFKSAEILSFSLPDLDSAELLLNQLIVRNSDHFPAKYFRGIIYEKKGNYTKAYEIFSDLIGKPYNQAATYYHLALAEINLNQADSACAHLKIASAYNLSEAKQLMNLHCEKESIFMSPYD